MTPLTQDWSAFADRLDGAGEEIDDVVDELVFQVLSGPPAAAATRPLIRALAMARSELSKRDAAVALARVAPFDDTDAVEALEDAYRRARADPSLGQALLGTMGLLGLRCPMARAAAAAAVQKLRPTENAYLLLAGAKVIGLLCGQRDDTDLRLKLAHIAESEDPAVASESHHQLAVLTMADAFQSGTNEGLIANLEDARIGFAAAERLAELRPDAELFRLLIGLILEFGGVTPGDQGVAQQARDQASRIRKQVGGFGERVFAGNGGPAWHHLQRRILDIAEALERVAGEIAGAEEWTRLHDSVVLLAESYSAMMTRPAAFLGQERLEGVLGGIAERVFRPRMGPVLTLHVSRVQFSRIIRDHERECGRDGVFRGLKALEEVALAAERDGHFHLAPQNRTELAELAQRTGRSPDDLVGTMIGGLRRGDTERWAAQVGAVPRGGGLSPVPSWREPLWEALRVAFTQTSFKRMLWMKLNIHLEQIASAGNFQDVVADVIMWAESSGHVADLARAAQAASPDNRELKRFIDEHGGGL